MTTYVHGYSSREARRLADQADVLAGLLHAGTAYPDGSRVLEAGCGVGAQTTHLAARSPGARIVSVDHSEESLALARARVHAPGVEWQRADLYELPFAGASFDHVFVCFVLEHLKEPAGVLAELRRVLRPGGSITVIEGDHGSAFFHPDSPHARAAVDCLVRLQAAGGGDGLIGRRLGPLLAGAGFEEVAVEPRTVWADAARPALAEGFTRETFTAAIEGVREEALAAGFATPDDFDRGVADLHRTAAGDGAFHYVFFKASARAGAEAGAGAGR
ncbi:methyltransferase domain-containing protein [Streptomyces sp. 6N223]|uniref:methyltransferase domain-containing protein n=1 Tax=Streptomyces sp. 6N223 TaxID=3457412 RepID=UPI003FD49D20